MKEKLLNDCHNLVLLQVVCIIYLVLCAQPSCIIYISNAHIIVSVMAINTIDNDMS